MEEIFMRVCQLVSGEGTVPHAVEVSVHIGHLVETPTVEENSWQFTDSDTGETLTLRGAYRGELISGWGLSGFSDGKWMRWIME